MIGVLVAVRDELAHERDPVLGAEPVVDQADVVDRPRDRRQRGLVAVTQVSS